MSARTCTLAGWCLMAVLALLAGHLPVRASARGEDSSVAERGRDDAQGKGTLIVRVQGLQSDEGQLRFVLFDSKKNFLKRPILSEGLEIHNRQATWTTKGLLYGVYAVLVHHDLNSSGTMERHWYGKPKEPTGASNDAPAKFGPPKFKDAKFSFDTPTMTIVVPVR